MDLRYHSEVTIPAGTVALKGELYIPSEAKAVIIFSHGSGSSWFSKRNRTVPIYLQGKHFGTLLFDLLTTAEVQYYLSRFNISLLTETLVAATDWVKKLPEVKDCRIGYFGASTGAVSALKAAAELRCVADVVSGGGRPDMAEEVLSLVKTRVLVIVGSLGTEVLQLNRQAYKQLDCEKELAIVQGATHLFEEEGTPDKVTKLAARWFEKYLYKERPV